MKRKKKNKKLQLTNLTRGFLYRQGLKLIASQNFVEKFKQDYNIALKIRYKNREIDDETARYYIYCVVEAIIYCLDFGLDVYIPNVCYFKQKITDYVHNVKSHTGRILENVKKMSIQIATSTRLELKRKLNQDNEAYQEFLEQKKENFNKIMEYYKNLYSSDKEE